MARLSALLIILGLASGCLGPAGDPFNGEPSVAPVLGGENETQDLRVSQGETLSLEIERGDSYALFRVRNPSEEEEVHVQALISSSGADAFLGLTVFALTDQGYQWSISTVGLASSGKPYGVRLGHGERLLVLLIHVSIPTTATVSLDGMVSGASLAFIRSGPANLALAQSFQPGETPLTTRTFFYNASREATLDPDPTLWVNDERISSALNVTGPSLAFSSILVIPRAAAALSSVEWTAFDGANKHSMVVLSPATAHILVNAEAGEGPTSLALATRSAGALPWTIFFHFVVPVHERDGFHFIPYHEPAVIPQIPLQASARSDGPTASAHPIACIQATAAGPVACLG